MLRPPELRDLERECRLDILRQVKHERLCGRAERARSWAVTDALARLWHSALGSAEALQARCGARPVAVPQPQPNTGGH